MAALGTIVGTASNWVFDRYRNGSVTISGINGVGNTPLIRTWGFVIGSWQTTGLAATNGYEAGLWGSNDGVNIFQLQGSTNSDSIFPLNTEDGIGSNVVPLYYTWAIAILTGTPSGSFEIVVTLNSTFG